MVLSGIGLNDRSKNRATRREEGSMTGHPRQNQLSRRAFLRRAGGLAVAAPSLAAILAACTKPGGGGPSASANAIGTGGLLPPGAPYPLARQDKPVTWNIFDDNQPIASNLSPEKGATLQIYNWEEYVWKPIVRRFCEQYDCDFKITTFDNMEEAIGKMTSGQLSFDVFVPTIDYVGKLVTKKLILPLNHDYLPALASDVWPVYTSPFYDQEARYTVPYVVYVTGLAYRRDVISDDEFRAQPNPYDSLWNPTYKGKVGVYNSYRDVMTMTMIRRGETDLNTTDPAKITQAGDDLVEMTHAVNPISKTNVSYIGIPNNQVHVTQSWSGDAVAAWGYGPAYDMDVYETIGFWYPENRVGNVDNDLLVVPSSAKNPVLAHLFLNYMLEYKNAMDNFSYVGYQPPQIKADPDTLTTTFGMYGKSYGVQYVLPWLTDAVVRESDFQQGLRFGEITPEVDDLWLTQWSRFKSGA
jgi:spermidine/putrescine transport system substrate-binding protein